MLDRHTHSTVSDGSDPPARIVELAVQAGCSAVALTDHDSLAGLDAARHTAAALGVTLVPGCEVSCRRATRPDGTGTGAGSVHVLVYFVDQGDGPLQRELVRLRGDRARRNAELAEVLVRLGTGVTYEDAVAEAGGREEGVGRPHFARALVRAGAATDIDDAFDRFLAADRPAYVPKARLDPADVAGLAHDSGGVAVLAHPMSTGLERSELEGFVARMADAGLDGIEAVYGSYGPDERGWLRRLAARHGLLATGGSDFHGTFKPDLKVGTGRGDLNVPDDLLVMLQRRRG